MKFAGLWIRLFFLIFFIQLNSCSDTSVNPNEIDSPGELHLVWLKGLRKVSTEFNIADISKVQNFNLGDINGSTDFFFLLVNTGGNTVTDVILRSSNSTFLLYPNDLEFVLPNESFDFKETNEVTIIRITALHGPTINGQDFVKFMNAGINSSTIEISGKTLNENGTEQIITLVTQMSVNALFMDLTILDGAREIDLINSNGSILRGGFVVSDFVKRYVVTDVVQIENIGNVPIVYEIFRDNSLDTLRIGETLSLEPGNDSHIMFDSQGIVRDLSKFPKYSDGKNYIYLDWP